MNLEERHWERLLADIQGRQVIPVIGPELGMIEVDGKPVSLYRHLANQLVKRLELNTKDLPPVYGYYHVVNEFLAQQPQHPKGYERDEIYYIFREMIQESAWPTPEPLKQLAAITHFDLFVSTTFDMLMEQGLNEVRYGGKPRCRTYASCKKERIVDLPDDFRPEESATVFHSFGKLNPMNDFAVGDEDIEEYTYRMQSRDSRPYNLFDQFRDKRLLILGCSFPSWLTRFFLATATGIRFFSGGAPGLLADRLSSQDRQLVGSLERRKINVYSQGDAAMFVAELYRRWMGKFGKSGLARPSEPRDLPPAIAPESVFISFRNDDREVAREIAKRFREAGIDVWFDETDLEAGDHYKAKIANHIFKCFAFVPLISKASISNDQRPWFYQFEWRKAIEAAEFRFDTSKFILPLVVDDTSPKDGSIPAEFRKLHISPLADLDLLVRDIMGRIRDLRRERKLNPEIETTLDPGIETTLGPEIETTLVPEIETTLVPEIIPLEDALAFQSGPTVLLEGTDVFICYRRDDSEDATARIWDVLSEEFGSKRVFRDVDSIPPGVDFRVHIRNTLANCRVVLVIIGRDWINICDQDGKRRLDDSDDHVRIELEAALARKNLPVIPVLVRRAEIPDKKLLPDSIKSLAGQSGMTVRSDQHFRDDVGQLVRHLNKVGVKAALTES